MKNLLFVCDSFLGGGLETRIIDQIEILKKYHIKPFLLCHKFNPIYTNYFTAVSDSLTTNASDNIPAQTILNDIDTICKFCIKHNIDFIDCNPFWCLLPTALAANKLHIPSSFTLHGVTSGNFIGNEFLTAQSLYNLVLSYGFSQVFTVAEYLFNLYPQLTNCTIIRNGLNIDSLKQKPFKNTQKIAIASRLDEPKSKIVIDFLPELYNCNSIKQIDIFGDGDCPLVKQFVNDNHLENKVHIQGWTENLSDKIYNSDYMIIFGMGRVILDTIKSGTPAGLLGYGGFAGLVNHSNLLDFSKTNLTSWQKTDDSLPSELNKLFKKPSNYIFKATDLAIFNNESICKEYLSIIKKSVFYENAFIDKITESLTKNPSINILNNESIFLECIRMLSDGNKAINPNLFYNIFQTQFDKINELQQTNNHLKEKIDQKLSNRIRNRINKYNHKE